MLERFGFSPTQSRVYEALLRLGSTTGYAVSQELGVARANVYQALEDLVRRGAARKSATSPVQYAATGPAALLSELERSFRKDLKALESELQSLPLAGTGGAAALELLTSTDALQQRAAACADVSASEVLAVTGPWAETLNGRLEAARERRVQVRAVFLGDGAPDWMTGRGVAADELRGYWGGLPVAVVSDRGRAVCGIVGETGGSGIATTAPGVLPFLRHLLRRELAGA